MSTQSAWAAPGPVAYDLRSDTVTTPTLSMLQAIQACTLGDDVLDGDDNTTALEKHLAALSQHEAGLFVMSGTMGNQLAIRSHLTQPPHSVLCDHRGHILNYEAGGAATLSGAMIHGVVPSNGVYLTLEDIQQHVVLSDDIHFCPTRLISLENTLGGTIMPLAEVKRISAFAREQGIKLHLDGARLWEAVVAGAGSLSDFTSLFDSVSLCFSKGLGAPIGSMLVGHAGFIKHARHVRKSLGGGTRQLGILSAAARVAVDETFGQGVHGEGGKLQRTHEVAKKIADVWTGLGGKLSQPVETNMVWLDLKATNCSNERFVKLGAERGLKLLSGRLVIHYQVSDEVVTALEEVMKLAMSEASATTSKLGEKTYGLL